MPSIHPFNWRDDDKDESVANCDSFLMEVAYKTKVTRCHFGLINERFLTS